MPEDLYSELLHIPPGPRPPNYYELLGIPLLEADARVIHAAVLRQSAELKRWALDPDPDRAQRVQDMLNEVNRAGTVLEDPTARRDYQDWLIEHTLELEHLEPESPAAPPEEAAPPRKPRVPTRACPLCGAGMEADERFCPSCRHDTEWERALAAPEPAPERPGARPARRPRSVGVRKPAAERPGRRTRHVAPADTIPVERLSFGSCLLVLGVVLCVVVVVSVLLAVGVGSQEKLGAELDAARTAGAPRLQAEAAERLGKPVETTVDLGGVSLELVFVPAGSFRMGSEREIFGFDARPVHDVRIAKPFYIGKYEVTWEQWQAVMGSNPSRLGDPKKPVDAVSWNACQDFVRKLSDKTGRRFSLPSEAEWEYACRAGSTTEFCFGDGGAGMSDYAWYSANANGMAHPVGQKKPNKWGLFDMHGNVYEWCEDVWHDSYRGAPTDGSAWVEGGQQGLRVPRGGSWGDTPPGCRSACRGWYAPSGRALFGCRVVLRDF